MYICMYICMYVWMDGWMHVRMSVYIYMLCIDFCHFWTPRHFGIYGIVLQSYEEILKKSKFSNKITKKNV